MITVLGRYKIVAEIGQGAMGTVYKAVDPVIDRTVAIKTINLNLSKQELEEYQARFQQEVKAAGRLNHPNIVTIYDVGKTESVAYMAMEFLEGLELKDIIASGQLPPLEQVVDIIAQVADGLWFAHQQDIVHRDVKPSNIMVLKGGIAKITDFGIARLPNSAVKTMTGLILGSPRYMSPEQVIGKNLDTRTDIFSLGVVLYEALTGVAPFDGDNVNAIMYATVNSTPPPPSSHNRHVPAMLDLIVAKAMAKSVDDRYQSVKEFADDLREVRRQMDAAKPSVALKARNAPPPPRPPADILGQDVSTIPLAPEGKLDKAALREDETTKPLEIAKGFDSFDATLRLAAMTNQTEEFSDYITATQKMRAYRGKIEPGSPLAPATPPPAEAPAAPPAPQAPAAAEPAAEADAPALRPIPRFANPPLAAREDAPAFPESTGSNTPALIAIAVLTLAAIGLLIALLVK
jgi:serine/threonine-protein kinase